MHARSTTVLAAAVLLLTAFSAAGQHSFERTVTVDPSGNADRTTIQGAINSITPGGDKWTVLVYAGVYDDNITLDGEDENIDVVGVDRDAVIIRPSTDGPGIKITSGTETERNNRIANLTIDTTTSTNGGHGVEIVKGGGVGATTPTNIIIDGVTIRAAGTDNHGIEGSAAEDVRINDCDIDAGDAMGVRPGSRFEIVNSIVQNQSLRMDIGAVHIDGGRTNITIDNCVIRGGRAGIFAGEPASDNVQVSGCDIRGTMRGVLVYSLGSDWLLRDCRIRAENIDRDGTPISVEPTKPVVHGVNLKSLKAGDITMQSCRIAGVGHKVDTVGGVTPDRVTGIRNVNLSDVRVLECDISAVGMIDAQTNVFGVNSAGRFVIEGGSVRTAHFEPDGATPFNKAVDVFDLKDDASAGANIAVAGAAFTKWLGPIDAAGRNASVTQTVIDIGLAADDGILVATALTSSEQTISEANLDGQPDVYRVLSVTGNSAGMDQDVYIEGTNWGGERIVEKITLDGTNTVAGKKPFKTVTSVILPAESSAAPQQVVEVGTTDILGLYDPISSEADVLQQARAANITSSYTFESVGTVDEVHATVDVSATIEAGNAFQWRLLTAQ